MIDLSKYKQTAIKAGIVGGATLATYIGISGLEDLSTNPTLKETVDLGQSVATIAVPYILASKFMRRSGDSSLIRYATQVLPMLFVPEVLSDLDFLIPSGLREHYLGVLRDRANFVSAAAASIPFLGDIKRALNKSS